MNNKYNKTAKKVGVMGIPEVGLPKFTKWDFVRLGLGKIAKKVGEGKYDHCGYYGHPTAIVGGTRVESLKSKVAV